MNLNKIRTWVWTNASLQGGSKVLLSGFKDFEKQKRYSPVVFVQGYYASICIMSIWCLWVSVVP